MGGMLMIGMVAWPGGVCFERHAIPAAGQKGRRRYDRYDFTGLDDFNARCPSANKLCTARLRNSIRRRHLDEQPFSWRFARISSSIGFFLAWIGVDSVSQPLLLLRKKTTRDLTPLATLPQFGTMCRIRSRRANRKTFGTKYRHRCESALRIYKCRG